LACGPDLLSAAIAATLKVEIPEIAAMAGKE
jgi:hypothetical protein